MDGFVQIVFLLFLRCNALTTDGGENKPKLRQISFFDLANTQQNDVYENLQGFLHEDGAILVTHVPGLAVEASLALDEVGQCFDSAQVAATGDEGPVSTPLDGGAHRLTIATATESGMKMPLPSWVPSRCPNVTEPVGNLRNTVQNTVGTLLKSLDQVHGHIVGYSLETFFDRGTMIEHFHQYGSHDENGGKAVLHGSDKALDFHTDGGLMQALLVRWRRSVAGAGFQKASLQIELADGSLIEAPEPLIWEEQGTESANAVLFLAGAGLEQWLPFLQARAAPHAVATNQERDVHRLMYGIMLLPWSDFLMGPGVGSPQITFEEWFSNEGNQSSDQNAWMPSCMPVERFSSRRLHSEGASPRTCSAKGKYFCWMSCFSESYIQDQMDGWANCFDSATLSEDYGQYAGTYSSSSVKNTFTNGNFKIEWIDKVWTLKDGETATGVQWTHLPFFQPKPVNMYMYRGFSWASAEDQYPKIVFLLKSLPLNGWHVWVAAAAVMGFKVLSIGMGRWQKRFTKPSTRKATDILLQVVCHGAHLLLGCLIMLISMTFALEFALAVILGAGLAGFWLQDERGQPKRPPSTADHHRAEAQAKSMSLGPVFSGLAPGLIDPEMVGGNGNLEIQTHESGKTDFLRMMRLRRQGVVTVAIVAVLTLVAALMFPDCEGDDCVCSSNMTMYLRGFALRDPINDGCLSIFFGHWAVDEEYKFGIALIGVVVLGFATEWLWTKLSRKNVWAPFLTALQQTLELLAMMVSMTFSVELFLGVLLGLTIGHFVGTSDQVCCTKSQQKLSTVLAGMFNDIWRRRVRTFGVLVIVPGLVWFGIHQMHPEDLCQAEDAKTDMYMDGFVFSLGGESGANAMCLVFLQESLVLRTASHFSASVIVVYLMGFCGEVLRYIDQKQTSGLQNWSVPLYTIRKMLGYLAMLVLMTYSVELVGALVVGSMAGFFVLNLGSPNGSASLCCITHETEDVKAEGKLEGDSQTLSKPSGHIFKGVASVAIYIAALCGAIYLCLHVRDDMPEDHHQFQYRASPVMVAVVFIFAVAVTRSSRRQISEVHPKLLELEAS